MTPDLTNHEGLTSYLSSLPQEDRHVPVWVHPNIVPHLLNAFGKNNAVIAHPGATVPQLQNTPRTNQAVDTPTAPSLGSVDIPPANLSAPDPALTGTAPLSPPSQLGPGVPSLTVTGANDNPTSIWDTINPNITSPSIDTNSPPGGSTGGGNIKPGGGGGGGTGGGGGLTPLQQSQADMARQAAADAKIAWSQNLPSNINYQGSHLGGPTSDAGPTMFSARHYIDDQGVIRLVANPNLAWNSNVPNSFGNAIRAIAEK